MNPGESFNPRSFKKMSRDFSSQDGSIGRHGLYLHTSKLPLKYRITITHSELSEIELNGSLIAMELKKPHPSRLVRRSTDAEWAGPTPTCGASKFSRDILGVRSPSPTPRPPAQGSSSRKISPHNFGLKNKNPNKQTHTHTKQGWSGL